MLTGPTGAGKSTTASELLNRHGTTGRLTVLERDAFADMAGRLVVPPGTPEMKHLWETSFPAITAAAREYLRGGLSVLVVATFSERQFLRIDRAFAKFEPTYVLLLPSWKTNRARRQKRLDENGPAELEMCSWDSHRSYYDELLQMDHAGYFDAVIDGTRRKPKSIADELAPLLGLTK